MQIRRTANLALMVLVSLALGACMTKPLFLVGNLEDMASDAADDYSTNLRWGRLAEAAAFVEPIRRQEFVAFFAEGHRYRFTDLEVDALIYDEATLSAHASVRFMLYAMPMVREIQVMDWQQWRFDRKTESWYIDPNLEAFRGLR